MIEIPQLEGTCGLRCREAKKDWFLRARIKNNYLGNDNTKPLSIPCSLARINNDGFLDMGTDSIVFKINNSAVMKIYPNLSISYLLKYQQEIDRIRNENFNPIVVDNKEYFFEVVPIKHIVESPGKRHCVIGYSPFVSGLNYHQYLLEYYKKFNGYPPTEPTDFEGTLSLFFTDYYRKRLHNIKNLYLSSRNFKVSFEKQQIFITDLASNISNFVKDTEL